jgi:uncharacterized protein (TIGR03435 family)
MYSIPNSLSESATYFTSHHAHFGVKLNSTTRGKIMKHVVLMLVFLITAMPAASQTPAQKLSFEVASIKPNKSAQPRVAVPVAFLSGGRFSAKNASLVDVIVQVYPTRRIQMQGGPDWIDSETFDIVAKAYDADANGGRDQMRQMVQALLEDCFQLRLHVEKKEMSVYALVVGKDAPKLQEPKEGEATGVVRGERGQMTFTRMSIVGLVNTMANIVRTPVVDSTGLKGFYDFTLDPLQFSNGVARDSYEYGNAVLSAVQEQLGFKIEKRKELLDITVIDHAERPSEN